MDITVEKFKEGFIKVFGLRCWKKFRRKFRIGGQVSEFSSIDEIEKQLENHIKHIDKVKNFYNSKNNQFLRLILISIEKTKGPEGSRGIDFSSNYNNNGGNEMKYEIEHIIPKSEFSNRIRDEDFGNVHKHNLSNLTLISRDLNNNEDYKTATFNCKSKLIQKFDDGNLYINKIFKESAATDESLRKLLVSRQEDIKKEFKEIFYKNGKLDFSQFYELVLSN